jgi:uncharacterized protein YbgA (DUF1722 family)
MPRARVRDEYEAAFMKTLSIVATPRRHTNVLMHMAGHLKKQLDAASKQELLDLHRGVPPRARAADRAAHAPPPPRPRARGHVYLAGQTYLQPHPRELMLRNHV